MTITVNYQKRKNSSLFQKFQTNKHINLSNVLNYIPIYDRFFSLNENNFNSINLNHKWAITDIKDIKNKDSQNVFYSKIKNIFDEDCIINNQKIFIKMAPLLDPFKYLVGKYNYLDSELFNLPSDPTIKIHPKIADQNNSSFIDGFFSFLSNQTLHEHNFIHGIEYYGSFLAIKNDFKLNVIDDIDYLVQSDFFVKQQNVLFNIDDYSHLINEIENKKLEPIKISTSLKSNQSVLSLKSIDDNLYENIFQNSNSHVSLEDIKTMGVELVDITESNAFDVSSLRDKKSETLKSGSTCSSRTSYTSENENESNSNSIIESNENKVSEDNICSEDDVSSDGDYEESLFVTFPKFPVQVICMECCENTFDSLIINGNLSEEEWFSALMQIIMILISYQKMFSFTHNDLHTNNIMYIPTNKQFLYYTFKKKTYKVPTFGKIYKIIDFGRAIYKFNGNLFCSDSFQAGGDAATQYNTEPYYNDKKPRLEPNFSFDICRLACSIFDYIVDDFDMIKNINECSPLVKLIVEWCIDDNGINVLYKNNGVERYPDFKLYKMIARYVHNHTPISQLERKEFSKYQILNKNVAKNEQIIDIDNLPIY
uniref:Protein kinase domain-containing protein n=1 Tax=viral metagenome TaxID=1070528 RepID=A0A6C0KRU5_9ZZZZ